MIEGRPAMVVPGCGEDRADARRMVPAIDRLWVTSAMADRSNLDQPMEPWDQRQERVAVGSEWRCSAGAETGHTARHLTGKIGGNMIGEEREDFKDGRAGWP